MWLIPTARGMTRTLMQRVFGGAVRQRLQYFQLDLGRIVQEPAEARLMHDENLDRTRRRHRRVARTTRDERHLAEEGAGAQQLRLVPRGLDVDGPIEEEEELVALPPLFDQLRTRRQAQLVRQRRDLAQLLLRATGEQRHLPEQFELRILAHPHDPILTSVVGAPKG